MDDRFYGTYNSYVLTLQTNTTEVYLQASNRITGSNHDETTQFYSQALTYNFDGASQGYEVVVAQMTTDNDFVFYVFDENLVDMHQRPTVTDIVEDIPNEGQLVSNPVRMNGLRGTNTEDVCALGYDEDDDNMELLCYDITAGVLDPDGFDGFTGDTPFDITGDDNIIILPVQTSGTTQSGQNLNEILTPYGIYSLCYNCGALNSDTLVQEFSIGLDAGTASFYDVQGIGASDILFTTENTFYYIDDNEANLVPEITFSEFNPGNANGLPVCINEQVKITIEVNDNEGNPITCYYEEQYVNGTVASTGANQSITVAGSIIWFTTADEAGTFLYQFYCNDGYHATAGTKTEQLVVGAVNVTQCNTFDEGVSSTAYDTTSTSNDPTADNSLVQLLTTVNDLNGIGFTSLWILLMLGVAVGIWYQAGHGSASVTSQTWGVIGLVEIGLLVVGVMQGFIGFGVIAVLVILSLAILAFRFRDEIAGR